MTDFTPAFYESFFNEGIYIVEHPAEYSRSVAQHPVSIVEEDPEIYAPQVTKDEITLFLFNYPDSERLPEKDEMFFKNILNAIRLENNSFQIINLFKQAEELKNLQEKFAIKSIVSFNTQNELIPAEAELNQIYNSPSSKILKTWPLMDIAHDKNKKSILWMALKKMFNL